MCVDIEQLLKRTFYFKKNNKILNAQQQFDLFLISYK